MTRRIRTGGLLALLLGLTSIQPAFAAPIANPVATFSGLDKITARITNFDVYINETVQFGSLQITPRVCYTRPDTETQRTSVFVEVDQVSLKGATQRIFTGWMFADSPALNAIDDAVYDFWLVDCKQRSDVPPPTTTNPVPGPAPGATPAPAGTAPAKTLPPPTTASTTPQTIPPTNASTAAAGDADGQPVATEDGSIITLMNPNPTAQTSPDGQ